MGGARELAEMLRMMGRNGDTMLAHITPKEAQMLMDMGGAGTENPQTGLPEFYDADIQGSEGFYGQPMYDYDVEAQQGGFYGETPTALYEPSYGLTVLGQPRPDFETPMEVRGYSRQTPQGATFTPAPQVGDAEAQYGGFYGGRMPSPAEFALTQPQPGVVARGAQAVEDTAATARALANKYPTVAKLLSTGATSLPALLQAARARREGAGAAEQFRRLGEPLRTQGEALRQQALTGGLTPQQAQQQEAERARLRQGAATRGTTTGTQAAMIENQLARQRAGLSETNLNNAIKMLNLANAYDEAAIKAKLASDAEVSDTLARIFSNIGQDYTSQQRPAQPQQPTRSAGLAGQPETTRRPEFRG